MGRERSKVVLLILAWIGLGLLGIDRMYAGQILIGLLKLITPVVSKDMKLSRAKMNNSKIVEIKPRS